MPRTPPPFARGWLLPVSLVAVLTLVLLMKDAFTPATGAITHPLPATAGAGTPLRISDGAFLAGRGKLKLDDELIFVQRVHAGTGLAVTTGKDLRDSPETFEVVARGLDGTEPADHEAWTEVRSTDSMFFPENNATFGEDVDALFYLVLWITGIAFILSEAFLLYCILGFKARKGERSHYSHGHHRLEVFWTLGTALILVVLAVVQYDMWNEMKARQPAPEEDPVRVQVLGESFKWAFRLPGIDGEFGTRDDIFTGTLTVPRGRKIAVELRSRDVLHSFFLPNFRVKQDAVPGMSIPVWFEAINAGEYPIMCAELCGLGHSTMGTTLEVLEPEAWQTWMEEASAESAEYIDEYTPRPEWHDKIWWWWDSNPIPVGYTGDPARKRAD